MFTRTKHRANRLAEYLVRARHLRRAHPRQPLAEPAHAGARRLQERAATACSSPPTSPRAASTSRRSATSSTSTCPAVPEDYIHRVGRTARAELTGDAFTFVAPEEEGDLRARSNARWGVSCPRDAARLRLPESRRHAARSAARATHRRGSCPTVRGAGARSGQGAPARSQTRRASSKPSWPPRCKSTRRRRPAPRA